MLIMMADSVDMNTTQIPIPQSLPTSAQFKWPILSSAAVKDEYSINIYHELICTFIKVIYQPKSLSVIQFSLSKRYQRVGKPPGTGITFTVTIRNIDISMH
jgi:hypothetical protein